jgi:hypothetical protein
MVVKIGSIGLALMIGWIALNIATDESPGRVFCWLGLHKYRKVGNYITPTWDWFSCCRCGNKDIRRNPLDR